MIINMNGAKAPETPSSVLQEKTVTPETLPMVIGPDEGYDGLSQVTVNPDSQLIPTNIRSGKTIFGVTGTFEGAGADDTVFKIMDAGPGRFHEVTVDSTTFGGYTHLKEYALSYCTVSDTGWDLSSYTPTGNYCCSHIVQAVLESGNMVLKGPIKIKNGTSYMFDNARLINLPEGLTYLYDNMFANCSFVENIEIPSGITTLNGLRNVVKLKSNGNGESLEITVPETVTQIASGYQCISGSSSYPLNLVMKSATPPTVKGSSSLANINRITVPVGCLEAYQTADKWSQFADKMVEATQ